MSDAIDELSRRLFETARDERPDDELTARIRAQSAAPDAPWAGEAAPRSAARVAELPRTRRVLRWRWLAIAAAIGGACLLALLRGATPDGRMTISAEARRAARPSEPAPVPLQRETAPSLQGPAAPPQSPDPRAEPVSARRTQTPPPRRSSPAPSPAPSRTSAATASSLAAARDTSAAAADTRAVAPEQRPPAPISAQIELLERARSRLRAGDGAGALQAVDRYDTELHGTSLNDEAALLRIEALSALGRRSEASSLAHAFVAAHPDSPLAERAQRFVTEQGRAAASTSSP